MSEEEQSSNEEWLPLEIPELGISFKRYKSDAMTKFICAWKDANNSHVYEIDIKPHPIGSGWSAIGRTDGHNIFTMSAPGRWRITNMALAAMRASLKSTHRHALKTIRKATQALAEAVIGDSVENLKADFTKKNPPRNPFED